MTTRAPSRAALLVLALALLFVGGCAAPTPGDDFELSTGLSVAPGAGAVVGFAQRIHATPRERYDLVLDWSRQSVDAAVSPIGDEGDTLDFIRLGVRYRRAGWSARFGAAWVRAQGDPERLPGGRDYGGAHFGLGREFALGERFLTGPEVLVHYVDSEGTGTSGVLTEFVWRLTWRL